VEAVRALDLGFDVSCLQDKPAELAARLNERIKLAAKLLGKTTGAQHSKSLEAVAQALRFPNWHQLSTHLRRAELEASSLPANWCDSLSGALLLLAECEPEISLPKSQIQAFVGFGQTLAMLTDAPLQDVLDGVCAGLCAGTSWSEVRDRSPLRAATALYRFGIDEPLECDVDDDERRDGKPFGHFDWSPACFELVETLDEWWQGYDGFTKPQKKKARKWVEDVLAAQPGFLEAGLALATMQNGAREAEASATLDRFIRQAEALIPAGFKGRIEWAHIENRFYHRMLWLRLQMHYDAGDLKSAVKFARKQLKLNPGDNLGVRFVHPLLLLRLREFAAAKRATKALAGEAMTAAVIRAFCEFALGNGTAFRRELAEALVSLPVLRLLLLNQAGPLPEGDDGYRGIRPELDVFMAFAWGVYHEVPGLRNACCSFLAEPRVLHVEAELRRYWKGLSRSGAERVGTMDGWAALCVRARDELAEPLSQAYPAHIRRQE
jgi:hypothetical protein